MRRDREVYVATAGHHAAKPGTQGLPGFPFVGLLPGKYDAAGGVDHIEGRVKVVLNIATGEERDRLVRAVMYPDGDRAPFVQRCWMCCQTPLQIAAREKHNGRAGIFAHIFSAVGWYVRQRRLEVLLLSR